MGKGDGFMGWGAWPHGSPHREHKWPEAILLKVGQLVSSYTHTTSSAATTERECCEGVRAPIAEAVSQINLDDKVFAASSDPVTHLHMRRWGWPWRTWPPGYTSPSPQELDEVYAWMVVMGGRQCIRHY